MFKNTAAFIIALTLIATPVAAAEDLRPQPRGTGNTTQGKAINQSVLDASKDLAKEKRQDTRPRPSKDARIQADNKHLNAGRAQAQERSDKAMTGAHTAIGTGITGGAAGLQQGMKTSPQKGLHIKQENLRNDDIKKALKAKHGDFGNSKTNPKDMDMMERARRVMQEASKSAEADLKEAMDEVKAINKEKSKLKEKIEEAQESLSGKPPEQDPASTATAKKLPLDIQQKPDESKAELGKIDAKDAASGNYKSPEEQYEEDIDTMEKRMDELNKAEEEKQKKLREAQERRQKALEALSNMMKKESDTETSIIENLK